jgi:hypothetical protein
MNGRRRPQGFREKSLAAEIRGTVTQLAKEEKHHTMPTISIVRL